jgi:hypothetical protein
VLFHNARRDREAESRVSLFGAEEWIEHAKELVAIDFLTVPTATCRVLYLFLVVAHDIAANP